MSTPTDSMPASVRGTDLLTPWAAARARLLEVVASLDEAAFGAAPAPGEWSPRQQLAHLWKMEGVWLGWALQVAGNPGAQFGDRHPGVTASVDHAADFSRDELIKLLDEARAITLDRAGSLTDDQLHQIGVHRSFGPMSALQCLRAIYRHDRMHTEQILDVPTTFLLPARPAGIDPTGWTTITRRVAFGETDPTSALAAASVVRYAEDAEAQFLTACGAAAVMPRRTPTIGLDVQLHSAVMEGEEVDVDITLRRLARSSLHYEFRVLRGPLRCASGRLVTTCLDAEGRRGPLPDAARALLDPLVLTGSDGAVPMPSWD